VSNTNTPKERLYEFFKDATEQICFDLKVDPSTKDIEKDDDHAEGHAYYTSSGFGALGRFRFMVDLNEKSKNISKRELKATLEINYSEGAAPFYMRENILWLEPHGQFLGRWAAWAVHNFNLDHNRINLESRFQEMDIRIYGLPGYSQPTVPEMKVLIAGLEKYQSDVLVYRFRHVSEDVRYRSFSYAFLVNFEYPYWVFFPELGGLDSGGAGGDFEETEEQLQQLSKKVSVRREYYDIKYEVLEAYLKEHATGFEGTLAPEDMSYTLVEPNGLFGDDFMQSYSKFSRRFEDHDYPHAMRDLRVLVERALKMTCQKKHVKISDISEQSIRKLTERLASKKVISGQQSAWFIAFATVANESAHDDYPKEADMQKSNIKHRILLTLVLGTQLISELESIVSSKKKRKGSNQ
jgi:hypothetical protein